MEFKHHTLDNGLDVIAEVNPLAASMAAGFFVKTGSRDETPEVAGVSHFLEHMMFKGTERRNAAQVNDDFDRMGANYNAFTAEENTVYFAAVLPEFQTQLLDLLGDMLRPSLRQEDFELEKNVIIDEIAHYEDLPAFRCYEKVMSVYFNGHPLGNSILGTADSIRALTGEQMRGYFERRYSPRNVIVTATGNVDFDSLIDKISQMCASWEPFDSPRAMPTAPNHVVTEVVTDKKVTRQHIAMMSPAPSCQNDGRHAARLASAVVGDTSGSRLYYALVEPALADEANTAYDPFDGTGAFLSFISADPERAVGALETARGEFDKFMDSGPTDAELEAAKNKIASGATARGELPMGRLTDVGFDWMYRNRYEPLGEQIERMFDVTAEEVTDVARSYDLNAMSLLALGPLESL